MNLKEIGCEDRRWIELAQDRVFGISDAEPSDFTIIVLVNCFHSSRRKGLINMDETAKFTDYPNKKFGPFE
jgi:hypothetical protein